MKCPHENCHYVGSSQQAVDTHVKHAHSTLVCDLCGKVTVAQNLKLHMATHHAPKTFENLRKPINVNGKIKKPHGTPGQRRKLLEDQETLWQTQES